MGESINFGSLGTCEHSFLYGNSSCEYVDFTNSIYKESEEDKLRNSLENALHGTEEAIRNVLRCFEGPKKFFLISMVILLVVFSITYFNQSAQGGFYGLSTRFFDRIGF